MYMQKTIVCSHIQNLRSPALITLVSNLPMYQLASDHSAAHKNTAIPVSIQLCLSFQKNSYLSAVFFSKSISGLVRSSGYDPVLSTVRSPGCGSVLGTVRSPGCHSVLGTVGGSRCGSVLGTVGSSGCGLIPGLRAGITFAGHTLCMIRIVLTGHAGGASCPRRTGCISRISRSGCFRCI